VCGVRVRHLKKEILLHISRIFFVAGVNNPTASAIRIEEIISIT
jgi:hypothetical protein